MQAMPHIELSGSLLKMAGKRSCSTESRKITAIAAQRPIPGIWPRNLGKWTSQPIYTAAYMAKADQTTLTAERVRKDEWTPSGLGRLR